MPRTVMHQGRLLGILLAALSVAPAPPDKLPASRGLLERRYKAALKLYDVAYSGARPLGTRFGCSDFDRR